MIFKPSSSVLKFTSFVLISLGLILAFSLFNFHSNEVSILETDDTEDGMIEQDHVAEIEPIKDQENEPTDLPRANEQEAQEHISPNVNSTMPQGLSLPFSEDDLLSSSGIINPFGVVRFSTDRAEFGHSGIDVPLQINSTLSAVADGEVVLIKDAGDMWGGQAIYLLLEQNHVGEGWGFIYEHVKPEANLKVGDKVSRGEKLGEKIAPDNFTVHLQMSYLFNDFEFLRENQCWVNNLTDENNSSFLSWWDNYKTTDHFLSSWSTVFGEGSYPYRGLLNEAVYPGGPRLCYAQGTDVR